MSSVHYLRLAWISGPLVELLVPTVKSTKALATAADIMMTYIDVGSDIIAYPTCDSTIDLGFVDSEQSGESSSNDPAKSGRKEPWPFSLVLPM